MTGAVYERLSEWLANLSLVFLASLVLPAFSGAIDIIFDVRLLSGIVLALGTLLLSLRTANVSEGRARR